MIRFKTDSGRPPAKGAVEKLVETLLRSSGMVGSGDPKADLKKYLDAVAAAHDAEVAADVEQLRSLLEARADVKADEVNDLAAKIAEKIAEQAERTKAEKRSIGFKPE